jgi:hypothetical protein
VDEGLRSDGVLEAGSHDSSPQELAGRGGAGRRGRSLGFVRDAGRGSAAPDGASDPVSSTTTFAAGAAGGAQAADGLIASLDEQQKAALLIDFTAENATSWSLHPPWSSCLVGIPLSGLSDEQVAAAEAVL